MKSCIKRQSYGFTLIEAIVAMAILGAAMLPIMALLSQSINQIHKIAESNAQSAAKNSALSVIDPINPMETPNGEIDMGDFNLVWSSELIVPPNKEIKIGTIIVMPSKVNKAPRIFSMGLSFMKQTFY